MAAWFNGLSGVGKTITALGTAAATVFAIAVALGGWFGVPAQVETNTIRVDVNTRAITRDSLQIQGVSQKMDAMICLQLLDDGADPAGCL